MTKTKTAVGRKMKAQNIIICVLVAVLAVMTIGFASYSTNLTIGGADNLTVKAAKWNVHWDKDSYKESTSSVAATTHSVTDTSITFTTTLTKPGDFYEFTIDAKNDGTFDADLSSVTMSDMSNYSDYLKYTIQYDGEEFKNVSTTLSSAKTLAAGTSKTATVRVSYELPSDSSKLPQEDVTVTMTATFNYTQAN